MLDIHRHCLQEQVLSVEKDGPATRSESTASVIELNRDSQVVLVVSPPIPAGSIFYVGFLAPCIMFQSIPLGGLVLKACSGMRPF